MSIQRSISDSNQQSAQTKACMDGSVAGESDETKSALDWPRDQRFSFVDSPGEHDPCYVVMPGGAMIALNHDASPGVDIARAKFIVDACNAAIERKRHSLFFEPSGDGMAACIRDENGAIICEAHYEDFEDDPSVPERIMKTLWWGP